eukprot:CAMPEP_0119379766 /NCGR_PEP_ID=MMETSP1334-20130426/54060_1 /TAXON_ID=127549 /ORGANISM="Calcidiscus leptoporus, Strain RCC1130" /LENGTH=45 /DNA_ID= /DNA_START= /DNA_END= /DNA_ORIENTATION=
MTACEYRFAYWLARPATSLVLRPALSAASFVLPAASFALCPAALA